MTRSKVKKIALAAMAANHAGHVFFRYGSPMHCLLNGVGYLTMPLVCWFLVQGFYLTTSRPKYLSRLVFFALLSQPAYDLWAKACGREHAEPNFLITLSVCFVILLARDSRMPNPAKIALQAALCAVTIPMCWCVVAPAGVILFDRARAKGAAEPERARDAAFSAFLILDGLVAYCQVFGLSGVWTPVAFRYLYMVAAEAVFIAIAGMLAVSYELEPRTPAPGPVARIVGRYGFYVFFPAHFVLIWAAKAAVSRLSWMI